MSNLKMRAMRTLSRLKDEATLTCDDFELLISVTENFVSKLSDKDRIKFEHVFGAYVVGSTIFSESLGFKYIQYLLQGADVSCLQLTSGPVIPRAALDAEIRAVEAAAVVYYEDDICGSEYSASNFASASQVFNSPSKNSTDLLMDEKYMRKVAKRISDLKESGENEEERSFLEELLTQETFGGRSKVSTNERERARQSVRKAIKSAIARLIENPDTKSIGLHLLDNIRFGHNCTYTGNWKWSF